MASFDINTRADLVKRRTIPISSGLTFQTGRWVKLDANGNASTPSQGDGNVYLVILGNELRPDSIGSNSLTAQYGQNLYTLVTVGMNDTISAGDDLMVNAQGDLVVATATSTINVVAIAENAKNQGESGLKIRALR